MSLFGMIREKLAFPRRVGPQFDNALPSDAKSALKQHAGLFHEDALHPQIDAKLQALGATKRPFGWEFADGSRVECDTYRCSVTATGPRISAGAAPVRIEPTLD